jgi:SAM-dependent methyltransferase
MHLNSELLFRKYATPFFKNDLKVLEIGPAGFPSAYNKIINNSSITWHTIDFHDTVYIDADPGQLTFQLLTPYAFPVETASYDIVLSGQVMEHVEKFWLWMTEIKRVTKEGGLIITINPVSWPYHEAPFDCWRIFPQGIKALAEEMQLNCIMALFESLEKEYLINKFGSLKLIPGISYNYFEPKKITAKKIKWNKFIRKFSMLEYLQIPLEVAYDTISVLQKPC